MPSTALETTLSSTLMHATRSLLLAQKHGQRWRGHDSLRSAVQLREADFGSRERGPPHQ